MVMVKPNNNRDNLYGAVIMLRALRECRNSARLSTFGPSQSA